MEKNMVKATYISIIGFVIIIILRIILTHKILFLYNFDMKKVYGLLGLVIYIPILLLTSFATIFVIYYYYKNRLKAPLKYLYLIAPSFIYMIICILALFGIPD